MPKFFTLTYDAHSQIWEGYAELPTRYGDACYCHIPGKAGIIVFHNRVKGYNLFLRAMLKEYLIYEFMRVQSVARWALLGNLRLYVTKEQAEGVFGDSAKFDEDLPALRPPMTLQDFARKHEVENRHVGDNHDDTPSWFPPQSQLVRN